MSFLRFLGILAAGGALDTIPAHEDKRKLRAGWIALLVGIAAILIGRSADETTLGAAICVGAPVALVGAALLFAYAMEAKKYAHVAIGLIVALMGGCFALVAVGS